MPGNLPPPQSSSSQQRTSIKATAFVLRIIHLALCASLAIYAVLLHIVIAQEPRTEPKTFDEIVPFLVILVVLSLGIAVVAIPICRKRMLPPRKPPEHRDDTVPETNLPHSVSSAFGKYVTASILTWALQESIAIYGLVLGFMTYEAWPYYAFAGPALALMVFFTPRRLDLEAVARAALDEAEGL